MKRLLILLLTLTCVTVHSETIMAQGVQGLTYETYAGTGASPSRDPLANPTVRSTGVSANINYPSGSFGNNILGSGLIDRVIVKWTGWIKVPAAGTYTFGGSADDGIHVTVNNTVVIDSWIDSGNGFRTGTPITLGTNPVPITVWYYENGGGQTIVFQWIQNGSWQVVPTTVFATTAEYFAPPPPVATTPVYSNSAITATQTTKRTTGLAANPNGHNAVVEVTGDDNLISIQQVGVGGHYVNVNVQGNVNNIDVLQTSTTTARHYMEATVVGGNNTVTLQQRETAKTQFVDVSGNYNTITTNQKGSGNHFLQLNVTGNSHTASVIQDGAGSHNARVILNGSQPWNFTLNQNSNTSQNYNLPHSMSDGSTVNGTCSAIGGCSLIVNQQ